MEHAFDIQLQVYNLGICKDKHDIQILLKIYLFYA